jgi:hypothetical protein
MTADIRWPWIVGVIAIGAAWGPYGVPVTATTPASRPVVVAELFTSEGCSSCPPADAVLSQLAHQPPTDVDVVTIGEHVDYWDRLGWRDRFSSAELSARQSTYDANAFHRNEVYTPQIVIDGRFARVGSDVDGIRRDIQKAAEAQKAVVHVSIARADGRLFHIGLHTQLPEAYSPNGVVDVIVAATEDNLFTSVGAGENGGRVLRHDGVARWMRSVATLPAGERTWGARTELPVATDWNPANLKVICFLQERESRRIVGAGVARLLA